MRLAIEKCLQDNWAQLFGYAIALGGDREVGRDLLQATAERALSSRARPRDAHAIRAWLYRILRNIWIDEHRRATVRRAEREARGLEEPCGIERSFEDGLIAEITVRQGLARLDHNHREIIELVDLAGFSYGETAGILDVPVGTAMSRLSRARLALLEAIEIGNVRVLEPRQRRR